MDPSEERRKTPRSKANSFEKRKRGIYITAGSIALVLIGIVLQFYIFRTDYINAFGPDSKTQQWATRKLANYSFDAIDSLNNLHRLETAALLYSSKKIPIGTLTTKRRQMIAMMDHFQVNTDLWKELHHIESYDEAFNDANAFIEMVHQFELGNVEIDPVIESAETAIASWGLFKTESAQLEFTLRDNMERTLKAFLPIVESSFFGSYFLLGLCIILFAIGFVAGNQLINTQHRQYKRFELLISSISHDLGSPLHSIQSASSLLAGKLSPADRRKYTNMLNTSIKTVTRLVGDIVLAPQGIAPTLQLTYIDFEKWFLEFFTAYQERAARKGLDLTFTIDIHNMLVQIDPERMAQGVGNLLDNAIKYTDKGSISVSVKLRTQELQDHKRQLVVKVRDSGDGINAADLERIFRPFERAVPVDHVQEHGMGLGLSIVKRMAESYGGSITVESTVGAGSTFKLTLPVKTEVLENSVPWVQASEFGEVGIDESNDVGTKEILIVDDDPSISALIVGVLKEATFRVDTVNNGAEALAKIADEPYKVIITDIQMPGLSGFELARTIRTIVKDPPYIIGMTAARKDLANDPKAVVFDSTLVKPFNEEELLSEIEKGMKKGGKVSPNQSGWGALSR